MTARAKQFLAIVVGTTALACVLGICLDMVTAHVAVEYFSVHHSRIVNSQEPIVLALVWGVAASWWFGAIAGLVAAAINHRRMIPLPSSKILKWAAIACVVLWIALLSIMLGVLAITSLIPEEQRRPTFESDRRLIAVAVAHQCEYVLGAIATFIVAIRIWRAS